MPLFCCCTRQEKEDQVLAPKTAMASNDDYPTVEDAYLEGKTLMRRGGKELGVLTPGGPEDIRFRSFFGGSVEAILDAWHRMAALGLLPPDLLFLHYLWALMFMCLYPKNEAELCTLCGGVDPKTVRNKTWPFIFALHELEYHVVSTLCQNTFSHLNLPSPNNHLLLSFTFTEDFI